MTKEELIKALEEMHIPKDFICFEGMPGDCFCVEQAGPEKWEVYFSERGRRYDTVCFDHEEDAYDYLYKMAESLREKTKNIWK